MIEKRQLAAYLSELRYQVERVSPEWRTRTAVKYQQDGSAVVEDEDGAPLAKMLTESDAYLMQKAPGMLLELAETIEDLLGELRVARSERRSYAIVSNHLFGAKALGFTTKDGQHRVREAYEEVLDPTANKDWDW